MVESQSGPKVLARSYLPYLLDEDRPASLVVLQGISGLDEFFKYCGDLAAFKLLT